MKPITTYEIPDMASLIDEFDAAEPGSRVVYFRGDIGTITSLMGRKDPERQKIEEIRKWIFDQWQEGRGYPLQERVADHDYIYFIVKADWP